MFRRRVYYNGDKHIQIKHLEASLCASDNFTKFYLLTTFQFNTLRYSVSTIVCTTYGSADQKTALKQG